MARQGGSNVRQSRWWNNFEDNDRKCWGEFSSSFIDTRQKWL